MESTFIQTRKNDDGSTYKAVSVLDANRLITLADADDPKYFSYRIECECRNSEHSFCCCIKDQLDVDLVEYSNTVFFNRLKKQYLADLSSPDFTIEHRYNKFTDEYEGKYVVFWVFRDLTSLGNEIYNNISKGVLYFNDDYTPNIDKSYENWIRALNNPYNYVVGSSQELRGRVEYITTASFDLHIKLFKNLKDSDDKRLFEIRDEIKARHAYYKLLK